MSTILQPLNTTIQNTYFVWNSWELKYNNNSPNNYNNNIITYLEDEDFIQNYYTSM